jgi:virginiamycin B lyase
VTRDTQVWFGYITGGAVGHFDPATGHVTLYHLADANAELFSMAHDARGRIWFSEITLGKLGMVDSTTGRVTELPVPTVAGRSAALYGLVVAQNGAVWFANNAAAALVRYSPNDASFTFFQLSRSPGGLYGLTLDAAGTLWFTLSGSSTNVVGSMRPS